MNQDALREEIIAAVRSFHGAGLGVGTAGNLSARSGEHLLITPSGIPYQDLLPRDIVLLDMDGGVVRGDWQPSSEWRIHTAVYRQRPDAAAVVHVHSPYATAVACTRREIPAFHYMVALAGGDSIPCAEYATFGTEELSRNVLRALERRTACLLANHGVVTLGEDIRAAYQLAQVVESLAGQYYLSRQLGGPVLLDAAEMQVNLEQFSGYGRQRRDD